MNANPLSTALGRVSNNYRVQLLQGGLRVARHFVSVEREQGTLLDTLGRMRKTSGLAFARDWTWAELLEWAASHHRYQPFIEYGNDVLSFNDMNRRANRVGRRLQDAGIGTGTGLAIMMSNHPRFIDAVYAAQKIGAWSVPVNTALVGDGLAYILEHSEVSAVVCDHDSVAKVMAVRDRLPRLANIWVNTAEAPAGFTLPAGTQDFTALEQGTAGDGENIGLGVDHGAPAILMYTSGTTGLPKAVVSSYGQLRTRQIGMAAHLLVGPEDKLYSCLPLFHANALMISVIQALWVGIPLRLSKRFSASRFWRELAECGATQFNTVGSMIPVLLKTPPGPWDRAHRVRRVISAACPKEAWRPFEERFGTTLWEFYGAVDGAGLTIFNTGNAPVGSLGKPPRSLQWRLMTEDGREAGPGEPGELQVFVKNRSESRVAYWKNDKATGEKVTDGWLHTGDLMQKDENDFLYFVGRATDSMRVRGENVSAYEIEKVVDGHPDVLESAAFGVPSPLGEQDAMVTVIPVEGHTLDPADLLRYLRERLPKYAVPAWLEIVNELPKTGTHRVIKGDLKKRGVTSAAIKLDDALLTGSATATKQEKRHA
jgi:crotonobetaine/carnitine-CoA ligase